MTRLVTQVGWPLLILCAALLITAIPPLIKWARFEIQLSRRVRQYEAREEAGRVSRIRW